MTSWNLELLGTQSQLRNEVHQVSGKSEQTFLQYQIKSSADMSSSIESKDHDR